MLHRFSIAVVICTVVLILAGSLVTSTGSGLAVPDWPTTYGENMFLFPPSKWVGGIFYEHGHRLIASGVGLLTIILALWLWLKEPRAWVKRLGVAALAVVILQGLLGGLTVLYFLPAAISTAHAALAELFFCLTVAIALFTSEGWRRGDAIVDDARLRRLAATTTALIYTQILLGAAMRHTEAGLAIPDFPLMFGGILPDHWDSKIAIHFAHRVGALVVVAAIAATSIRVWKRHRSAGPLTSPARALIALVAVQVTLGALTVLSGRAVWINSLHVVFGALVLTTSLVLTLRAWRIRFAEGVRLKADTATVRSVRLPAFARWFARGLRRGTPKRDARRRQTDQDGGRPAEGARA
jgi:cytochrome c oxidase assembly protein subunit 15